MSRIVFTAVFVAVVFAASSVNAGFSCSQYNDCYSCTTSWSGECGWNDDYQTCNRGDPSTGYPIGYDYTPKWWAWKADRCCSQSTSCSSCTQVYDNRCGWNPSQQTCQYGVVAGSSTQIYSYSSCPSQLNCGWNLDCGSCLQNTNCGWDRNAQSCMAGDNSGPYNGWSYSWHYDSCPSQTWSWSSGAYSAPIWLTVFGVAAVIVVVLACVAGRRRRRLMMQQNQQSVAAIGTTNAAAPLMGAAVPHYSVGAINAFQPNVQPFTSQPGPSTHAATASSVCEPALYGPVADEIVDGEEAAPVVDAIQV